MSSPATVTGAGVWGLLPGVRIPERPRFRFFVTLSALITFAQTVGIAAAEALFLARLGAERLPLAFVIASGVTVVGSLAYAGIVGRARNDRLFVSLLLGFAGVLALLGAGASEGVPWAPYALLCAFYLTYAVLLNHLWTFAGDYFDTVASKRLFPLVQIGASAGGLVGGLVVAAGSRLVSPAVLVYVWAAALGVAAWYVGRARVRLEHWYPVELEERDESSVQGLRVAVRHLRGSSLGRGLVLSTAGMVLSLFVMQYLYSEIFVRAFPDETSLATFIGVYLAITNLLEIVVEGALTPWLIRRFGVGAANLVHPSLTLLAFGMLAIDGRLFAGVLARVNREMLENSVAAPVRALVQNAFPPRLRGKFRAFLEGIVVHGGMVLAGGALILIGPAAPTLWIAGFGGAAALLYLLASLRVRSAYFESLVGDVRRGRADIRERSEDLPLLPADRLVRLWESLLAEEAAGATPAVQQLARILARRRLSEALLPAISHPSAGIRRVTVQALASEWVELEGEPLAVALEDPDADVRLAAIGGWATGGNGRLERCLDDPDPRVRAAAAAHSGAAGASLLARMAADADPDVASVALRNLPSSLSELAVERVEAGDPAIRASALEALTRLTRPVPIPLSRLEAEARHPDAPVRRAALAALASIDERPAHAAIARALADPSREVRTTAARLLAGLGDRGVEIALDSMHGQPGWAAESALLAVSWSETPLAQAVLVSQFRLRARQAWSALRVLRVLPPGRDLSSRFLRAAYEDALLQNRRLAFRILELLEAPSVVRTVEKVLLFGSPRLRGPALEVLSHLGDREGAALLVRTLEEFYHPGGAGSDASTPDRDRGMLEVVREAQRALDRWTRIASTAGEIPAAATEATMERLLALRNVRLFGEMTLDQLEAINTLLVEQQFVAGEVVFREGDPGEHLYLVAEGAIDIVQGHGSDHPIRLAHFGPGACFGEIAVLDGAPRTAAAVAAESCTLLALGGDRFKELVYDMPELAFAIFRVLTSQVRRADERLAQYVQGGEIDRFRS